VTPTRGASHVHEWSALWSHFGPYGDQAAHFHVCLSDDHAPGWPCRVMFVGAGRDCTDGQEHEVREPKARVRHG
jgi:hypothetical protein